MRRPVVVVMNLEVREVGVTCEKASELYRNDTGGIEIL